MLPVLADICTPMPHPKMSDFEDPNRVRGVVNTGIVDVDGDGVEAHEFISAVFMGYPSGQPSSRPPDESGYFRRLQENYQAEVQLEDEHEMAKFGDKMHGCMYADVGELRDPNRVRGHVNTGIVDIDGDGVEVMEFVSAVFMGHPSGQPKEHPSLSKELYEKEMKTFRDLVAMEDAEEERRIKLGQGDDIPGLLASQHAGYDPSFHDQFPSQSQKVSGVPPGRFSYFGDEVFQYSPQLVEVSSARQHPTTSVWREPVPEESSDSDSRSRFAAL